MLLYPWRWWNVLNYSGLAQYWEKFKTLAEADGVHKARQWLRAEVSPEQFAVFLRRCGTDTRNNHSVHSKRVWTKTGAWPKDDSFTQILVLKQHLPERIPYLRWQHALGPANTKLIEKELMQLIDPDATFRTEARLRAIDYVRNRLGDLVIHKARASAQSACWFFMENIPADHGEMLVYQEHGRYIFRSQCLKYRSDWNF